MTNSRLLRAEMIKQGYKYADIAKLLGISLHSLSNKINNKADFKLREIVKLCEILNIQDKDKYFFI